MQRRSFIASLGAAALPLSPRAQPAPLAGWRTFELTTAIDLAPRTGPARVWLPLAGSVGSYQRHLGRHVSSTGRTRIVHDDHYRAPLLEVSWERDGPRGITSSRRWRPGIGPSIGPR